MLKDKSGFIIAAAFLGPGTITTASLAGAEFGFHLVWALLFSVLATLVLQDMAARLGIVSRQGLASALKQTIPAGWLQRVAMILVVCAIGVGNAAYESGNLTGAGLGLNNLLPLGVPLWASILGITSAVLLFSGGYTFIERLLTFLVFVMAVVFIITLWVATPDWSMMLAQLLAPQVTSDTITIVLALIGTTIVPYNLFLHASLAAKQNRVSDTQSALQQSRRSSGFAISFGGAITLVLIATAMTAFFGKATLNPANIGDQLEPLLGQNAKWLFGLGLFAAGLTSAITAPLAAAYAVCGALGYNDDLKSPAFRTIWATIIVLGVLVAAMGFKPLTAILFAQATNGLLLPVIACFLLYVMNQSKVMGEHTNGLLSNLAGAVVVLAVSGLGLYKLVSVFA